MNDQQRKLRAQTLIREAVSSYSAFSVSMPKEGLDSGNVHMLTEEQINSGVIAMLLQCGIAHGSGGSLELYKLNQRYLQDVKIREQINALLKSR